jgi:hypothetical protein
LLRRLLKILEKSLKGFGRHMTMISEWSRIFAKITTRP